MMRLTGIRACATSPAPALPWLTTGRRAGSLIGALADPQVRLGVGAVTLLVTALAVRRDRVSPGEAKMFRAVNSLPDALHAPAWAIMQLGTLGAAPATAGAAWLAGDPELAGRLLASGTGAWALSKLVKQMVRRPRPAALLAGTRCRGREAAGLGYLSGHAGVAIALGAAALPRLGPSGRALTVIAIPAVGLTRVYVGAHLPLDIAGGAALGLVVESLVSLAKSSGNRAGTPGPDPAARTLPASGRRDPLACRWAGIRRGGGVHSRHARYLRWRQRYRGKRAAGFHHRGPGADRADDGSLRGRGRCRDCDHAALPAVPVAGQPGWWRAANRRSSDRNHRSGWGRAPPGAGGGEPVAVAHWLVTGEPASRCCGGWRGNRRAVAQPFLAAHRLDHVVARGPSTTAHRHLLTPGSDLGFRRRDHRGGRPACPVRRA